VINHFPVHPSQSAPLLQLPYATKEMIYFVTHAFSERHVVTEIEESEMEDEDEV